MPNVKKLEELSEEDVKVKLIIPLFKILGWNVRNYRDAVMETEDYDKTIEKELLKKWPSLSKKGVGGVKVDCIFKINNKPHIILEAKRLNGSLPSLERLDGQRTVAYARKWRAKYVVFTNFLKMSIIDTKPSQPVVFADFKDMSEYISKYDQLKVLMKPNVQEDTIFRSKPTECFENFVYKQEECDNCNDTQRSICEATTKLKKLGYEMKHARLSSL